MVAGDAVSHVVSPSSDALSPVAASEAQLAAGHLLRCPQCGALNGRSVVACWSCEADLTNLVPLIAAGADAGPAGAARAVQEPEPGQPGAAGAELDMAVLLGSAAWDASDPKRSSVPVLTTPVSPGSLVPGHSEGPMAGAFLQPPRPRWGLFAIVGIALLFAGGGAYEVLRSNLPEALKPTFAGAPRDAALPAAPDAGLPAAPVTHAPGDLSHVDEALRTAEMLTRTPPDDASTEIVPVRPPDASPSRGRAVTAATVPGPRQGRTRNGSRTTGTRAPPASVGDVPAQRVDSGPAVRPAAGPCTATVAALGLCASPNQPKE
ncbi:MAG TPA: hypothetical protein VGM74_16730 [Burkholderiaceae bacterium]